MNVGSTEQRSLPIYGKIPSTIISGQGRQVDKVIITTSNKIIELPLEIVYAIFESESNILEFLLKCRLINVPFYNSVCGFLSSKSDVQREWVRKGFNQYNSGKIEGNIQSGQIEINTALQRMNVALSNINHVSFDLKFNGNNLIDSYFNKCKIISLSENKNLVTLHLDIYFESGEVSEEFKRIRDQVADHLATAFRGKKLREIELSIKGTMFSADNFVTILQAIKEKVDARVKISFVDCIFENTDLEEIAPYFGENIIDFELTQDRTVLSSLVGDNQVVLPTFELFSGKFINAKNITIRVGLISLEDLKNIDKIINRNIVNLNLSGIRDCNNVLEDLNILGGLGNAGVGYLVPVIKDKAKNIRVIDLSANSIDDDGIDSLLNLMLMESLKSINLSWNDFTIDGVKKIFLSLLDNEIEYINISHSDLSDNEGNIIHPKEVIRVINEFFEENANIIKINSENVLLKNPHSRLSYIYSKETFQRKNGKIINILLERESYWSYKDTQEHMEFLKIHSPDDIDGIAWFESRAQRFADGLEIDYKLGDVIPEEIESDGYGSDEVESEGAISEEMGSSYSFESSSSDESDSDGSIPPEMESFMRILDFSSSEG